MTRAVTLTVSVLMVLVISSVGDTNPAARASASRIDGTARHARVDFPTLPLEITSDATSQASASPEPLLTNSTVTRIPPVALVPGDEGAMVTALQTMLSQAGFYRSVIDGQYGSHTTHAVVAFHKAIDAERVTTWSEADWAHLSSYRPSIPSRPDEPNRLEVDLTRQLLYRIADGEVIDIVPISSGNGESYRNSAGNYVQARTPRGDYTFYKHYSGWRISYLGGLYQPWYFRGGYAIHGSNFVPPYPDSHGCVRVPNWEADHLTGQFWLGLPVHVWDAPPVADPPTFEMNWEEPEYRQRPTTFVPAAI